MNATIPEAHRLRTADQSTIDRRDPTRPPPTYQRGIVPKYSFRSSIYLLNLLATQIPSCFWPHQQFVSNSKHFS